MIATCMKALRMNALSVKAMRRALPRQHADRTVQVRQSIYGAKTEGAKRIMHSVGSLLFALLLAMTLAACSGGLRRAGAEMELKYTDYAGEPVERITTMRGVDSWTPVSRNQLVIWTGINEAWLITIWDNCPDLTFARGIRVTQTGSSISRFEKVMVGRDTCPIREIRPVDIKQMRSDRKAAKEAVPAP
jgi:hypothetical protein